MLNTLKDYNTNLFMFIKIVNEKSAMIILGEKGIANENDDLHIVTDAVNLPNMYKEEYRDIALSNNGENYMVWGAFLLYSISISLYTKLIEIKVTQT